MRKNRVQRIVVHTVQSPDFTALGKQINDVYSGYIERRLREAGLTIEQKSTVIGVIICRLHAQE